MEAEQGISPADPEEVADLLARFNPEALRSDKTV
jgi:hypothetical protein